MCRDLLRNCVESLLLHRLRSALSTLGVFFGVAAIVAMLSIGEGAKKETLEQIAQLGTNTMLIRQIELSEDQHFYVREQKSKGLSIRDAQSFSLLKNVDNVAVIKNVEAKITGSSAEITPKILAINRCFQEIKGCRLTEGRFISDMDIAKKHLVCILGFGVAKKLGAKGHIGQSLAFENVEFKIIGILSPRKKEKSSVINTIDLNYSILIPIGTEIGLQVKNTLKEDTLTEIIVKMKEKTNIEYAASLVKRILEKNHFGVEDYQLIIPKELLKQAQRAQTTFNIILGSIAAISLLVGGIGIMNIMLANITERTREIGIRRAVGANSTHIIIQFLSETLLLTFVGGFCGIFAGIVLAKIISHYAGWPTVIKLWSIGLSISMALGVGLCAGFYPAWKASKMDPIKALRYD